MASSWRMRREHLAIRGVIVHRGDAAGEISLQALPQSPEQPVTADAERCVCRSNRPGRSVCPVASITRAPAGITAIGRHGFDLVAADHNRRLARRRARAIHHARAADHNRRRLGAQAD